jgi:hypothetical protein
MRSIRLARRMVAGGEEIGFADRHPQHRHLQAGEPDAHAGRQPVFLQQALEHHGHDLDGRAPRRGGGLLEHLLEGGCAP